MRRIQIGKASEVVAVARKLALKMLARCELRLFGQLQHARVRSGSRASVRQCGPDVRILVELTRERRKQVAVKRSLLHDEAEDSENVTADRPAAVAKRARWRRIRLAFARSGRGRVSQPRGSARGGQLRDERAHTRQL